MPRSEGTGRLGGAAVAARAALMTACAALMTACAALMAGCTLPFRALPLDDGRPAHSRPFRQTQDGVLLAAELVSDDAECRAYFHEALTQDRVVPVIVRVENISERTAVLRRERFTLRLEGEPEPVLPTAPTTVIERYQRGLGVGYLGLPVLVPYLVMRQEVARFNFELERDLRGKGLPAYLRVAPGDPPVAFALFFEVSEQAMAKLGRSPVLEVHAEIEGEEGRLGKDVRFLLSVE
ncbi:MAG: hypothetical protein AB7O52_17835 [Planctomycetota bacterium]